MRSYLVDVNVWLALSAERHVHYEKAHKWFADVGAGKSAFCRFTQVGFLRLITNRKVMGDDVLTPARAWDVYDALLSDERVTFAHESPEVAPWFERLTRQRPNVDWTDSYLAALAAALGFTLVTFDRAASRLDGMDSLVLR